MAKGQRAGLNRLRLGRVPSKPERRAPPGRSEARSSPELKEALTKIGSRVVALRGERGLTQDQLASTATLDVKHVQDVEHGRSTLTVATLLGLARALDVSVADLVADV